MNKEILERYAQLKMEAKMIEEEIKDLQPQVVEIMGDNEELEVKGVGTFIRAIRRAWTYPEAIKNAEADLKVAKKEAEQTGDATAVENPYLLFKNEK